MNAQMHSIEADGRGIILACPNCGQRNRLLYERLGSAFRCGKCQTEIAPPDAPIEIASATDFDSIMAKSTLPVLVDFWAPWCGPCRMIAPEVTKAAMLGAGQWLTVKVNTEDMPALAARFNISAIPLFAVFKNGRELARQAGGMSAQAMAQFVRQAARG
jgi:thioredoxin 2